VAAPSSCDAPLGSTSLHANSGYTTPKVAKTDRRFMGPPMLIRKQ
jgi:hypothetical protein